jgi:type IV pilus assembly protein PilY1
MNNLINSRFKTLSTFIVSASLASISTLSFAAPGPLVDTPLNLGIPVQPNILMLVDDSGSMDWEVLKSKGAIAAHGPWANGGDMDFSPNNTNEILELCPGYNVMAYNPNTTYSPWAGVDFNGNIYQNMSVTGARRNPYYNINVDNLSNHFYITWSDANSDGVYQNGECAVPTGYGSTLSAVECNVLTCATVGATDVNYANWYSYYRKREYVAKKALTQIVDDSSARMGLATLHNNNSVGTVISDMSTALNKNTLLDELSRIRSSGGTPLRQALNNAGKYFEVGENPSSGFFGSTPNYNMATDLTVSTDSPILNNTSGGQCQQNFTLLFSDGFSNGSNPPLPGNGNVDADGGSPGPEGVGNTIYDGGAYADTDNYTLADVAMYYFERDLATTLADDLGLTLHGKPVNHQHMTTYTIAFGVNGTLDASPVDPNAAFAWPTPIGNTNTTIDDMRHTAYNGRGEFLNASNPEELINSLNALISDIDARTSTSAAPAINSAQLSSDTAVFVAQYDTSDWSGDLKAFSLNPNATLGSETWAGSASDLLTARLALSNDRQIITYNGVSGIKFAFPTDYQDLSQDLSSATLSQTQVDDLTTSGPQAATPGSPDPAEKAAIQDYGESITKYLRGDGTKDGLLFRERNDKYLGAFIQSGALFVGESLQTYPDNLEAESYLTFKKDNAVSRRSMVYLGSNGGMLHGFYADNDTKDGTGLPNLDNKGGQEVFAYIPGIVSDENSGGNLLHSLANVNYNNLAYVDGSPNAVDVFVDRAYPRDTSDTDFTKKKWRTYLIGGFRAGGKGFYVLDVTDPRLLIDAETNADKIIVKEFTHPDLGYSYSKPQIVKMNNGRWAAVVGNGYNNYPSGDGTSKLFIFYLDALGGKEIINASQHAWPATSSCLVNATCTWPVTATATCLINSPCTRRYVRALYADSSYRYQELSKNFLCDTATFGITGSNIVSCDISDVDGNGLAEPRAVDMNGDFLVDRIYAGDLHGNMWAFNVEDKVDTTNWKVAHTGQKPLFVACRDTLPGNGKCAAADRQPITSAPAIRSNPRGQPITSPNIMVLFGTGQYIANDDNVQTTAQFQSFYGVWDAGSSYNLITRDELSEQLIDNDTSQIRGEEIDTRGIDSTPVTFQTSSPEENFGWHIDFKSATDPTERILITPFVIGRVLFITTNIPPTSRCGVEGGSGFFMPVDYVDGSQVNFGIFDFSGDGNFTDSKGLRLNSFPVGNTSVSDGQKIIRVPTGDGDDPDCLPDEDCCRNAEDCFPPNPYREPGIKSWFIIR